MFHSIIKTQNIERSSYGVTFKEKETFHMIADHYQIMLTIDLPITLKEHKHEPTQVQSNNGKPEQTSSTLVRFNLMTYYEQLNKFIDDLELLIPYNEKETLPRKKRGLINVVGQISKFLFGTTTEEDYMTLKTYMENNIKKDNEGKLLLEKQNKDFLTINKITNDRIDRTLQIIYGYSARTNYTLNVIEEQIKEIDHKYFSFQQHMINFNELISELHTLKIALMNAKKGYFRSLFHTPNRIEKNIR